MPKLTQEDFLSKAKAAHGNRYDYSRAVYMNSKTKVIIICSIHGIFKQTANDHWAGKGCKLCGQSAVGKARSHDLNIFLKKAQAIHGEKYDYSQVIYFRANSKVKIGCPMHGFFEQCPAQHIGRVRSGCLGCKSEKLSSYFKSNSNEFIKKAVAIHGTRYDYSNSVYTLSQSHVEVSCPIHGIFRVSPNNHLNGLGCKKCSHAALSLRFAETTNKFIIKARAVHGDKYDYSLVVRHPRKKVLITCPKHGIFIQHPANHLFGNGCPGCARSALKELRYLTWVERAGGRPCILYFLRLYTEGESFYKVGITYQSIEVRYKAKADLNGYTYEILAQHTSSDAARIYDWEQSILETFAHLYYRPKRSFHGETECFSSANEILAIFPL